MDSLQAKSRRHSSVVLLPDNLIEEVLSFLNVKSLTQFKCVCKSWKTLISDPTFIKLHLKRSARNGHLTLIYDYFYIVRFPLTRLVQNTTTTLVADPYFRQPCFRDTFFHYQSDFPQWMCLEVFGSCNGLLCLYGYVSTSDYEEIFLYLWNPATKTLSNKIVFLHDEYHLRKCEIKIFSLKDRWKFSFGYDKSTDNYKIVAFDVRINDVRVLNLGDHVWRHIQSFPVVPFDNFYPSPFDNQGKNDGVYVSGTVNWLAIPNVRMLCTLDLKFTVVNRFVIISLDLSTETYRQFLPPLCDEVVSVEPTLTVLMDSLCFSHDFHGTHLIIWQMKEFGFEESWTQFLKISYKSLTHFCRISLPLPLTLFPLSLSDNGDTLIVFCEENHSTILYNLRYDRGESIGISNLIEWICAKNYVESLVSTS